MALLSTFSLAVPVAVLDRVLNTSAEQQRIYKVIWLGSGPMLEAATLACFMATLSFYLQRSHLAFLYGQLTLSQTDAKYQDLPVRKLLRDADSWPAWGWYRIGFVTLPIGLILFGALIFHSVAIHAYQTWLIVALGVTGGLYVTVDLFVKGISPYADHPWRRWHMRGRVLVHLRRLWHSLAFW